jgi:MFS family permease
LRHVFAGGAVCSIGVYAVIGWLPAFLIRTHDMSASAAGTVLALLLGLVGGMGTLLGGFLSDRVGKRDAAWRLRVVTIAFLTVIPCWAMALYEERLAVVLVLLVVPCALLGFQLGPTFAVVQSLVEPAMRAFAAALLLLAGNLIGLGLGPLAVGLLSDLLQPTQGPDSLRFALLIVLPFYLWAAYHYQAASRTLSADLAACELRKG